jgi:hypothetical protein
LFFLSKLFYFSSNFVFFLNFWSIFNFFLSFLKFSIFLTFSTFFGEVYFCRISAIFTDFGTLVFRGVLRIDKKVYILRPFFSWFFRSLTWGRIRRHKLTFFALYGVFRDENHMVNIILPYFCYLNLKSAIFKSGFFPIYRPILFHMVISLALFFC